MSSDDEDIVAYRLGRANESLEEARILAEAKHWNAAVSRLYYACFYAVSALCLKSGFVSSKHTGMRAMFNREFVKSEKVGKEIARIYNDLFERRQESDYEDYFRFSHDDVAPWIQDVELFVRTLTDIIKK